MALQALSLTQAFDAALRAVDARGRQLDTPREPLEQLRRALLAEREAAMARGAPDREWVRRTVRDVVTWAPEDDLTLIAALGGIARATSR